MISNFSLSRTLGSRVFAVTTHPKIRLGFVASKVLELTEPRNSIRRSGHSQSERRATRTPCISNASTPVSRSARGRLSKVAWRIILKTASSALLFGGLPGHSQGFFYQLGCDRESVGFRNHFLEIACIIAIRTLIEHLIEEKRKVRYSELF